MHRSKGKSGHLILKADHNKEQKMPEERGQNQVSAVIKTVTDLVQVLSIQITVMTTGWKRNQCEKEQEKGSRNGQWTEPPRVATPLEAVLHTVLYSR